MALDVSGATLGAAIAAALALPPPPTNPTPAQEASYVAAKAAQIATWTTIAQQILTYLVANTQVVVNVTTTDTVLVTAVTTGVATAPGTGTGTGSGTGTIS